MKKQTRNTIFIIAAILILAYVAYVVWKLLSNKAIEPEDTDTVTQPEWKFFQGMDSPGGDLAHRPDLAGDTEQLKEICETTMGCMGFNTNGYFKKQLKSRINWKKTPGGPTDGLWVKSGKLI